MDISVALLLLHYSIFHALHDNILAMELSLSYLPDDMI
jgi:hypothetical protein